MKMMMMMVRNEDEDDDDDDDDDDDGEEARSKAMHESAFRSEALTQPSPRTRRHFPTKMMAASVSHRHGTMGRNSMIIRDYKISSQIYTYRYKISLKNL